MIDFVPEDFDKRPGITPTIVFSDDAGYLDAEIHYNGIPVAYFSGATGGITPLDFEDGPYRNGGQIETVKQLQAVGVKFKKKKGHIKGYWVYQIIMGV